MILRRLFGRGGDEPPPPPIENAWDLRQGDFLKLTLAAQKQRNTLNGAQLIVDGIRKEVA